MTLDPRAAYALSNLCALDLREGRLADADDRLPSAPLPSIPTLLAARRNLAIVRCAAVCRQRLAPLPPLSRSATGASKPPGE